MADIFYAIIIPLILILLVLLLAIYVNPSGTKHVLGVNGTGGTIAVIFTQGFAQMIVLGIPLVLGLLWNKWAGGAAGFITGGMYYLASAGLYTSYYATSSPSYNFFGDISLLAWIVNGCYHRLHGWSIVQQINEFHKNARCRVDSCGNSCDNPSLSQLHYCTYSRHGIWSIGLWHNTSFLGSWNLRIRVSLRSEYCFRRNSAYYC